MGAITKYTLDDSSIEFYPVNVKTSSGVVGKNKISYKNAYPNTDIRYSVESDSLKEEIILNSADAPSSYSYELKLDNLKYKTKEDGSIEFSFADSSKFAFNIPKPFMYEAGDMPQLSNNVIQTIRKEGDKLYLDVSADTNWIKESGRKFPITIDPTIRTGHKFFNDTFAGSSYPNRNYAGYSHIYSGTTTSYGKTDAYIRFPLPGLPDGAVIESANVYMYNDLAKSSTTKVNVYRIADWWSEGSVNWNNKPSLAQLNASIDVSSAMSNRPPCLL